MYEPLIQHIRKQVALSDEEVQILIPYLKTYNLNKKQFLLRTGHICKSNYFVSKGCLRMYFLQEDTEAEQTTQFALENWWITDQMSLLMQQPSQFCIQAVEASEVIAIDRSVEEELFQQLPQLERYFRIMLQRVYAAYQIRMKYIFGVNGKERYHFFARSFPGFVQRIPQYMLASYLGFSAEFLSKIRAQKE